MTARKVDVENSFIKSLRRANQLQCHLEDCSVKFADTEEKLKQHFTTTHQDVLQQATLTQLTGNCRRFNQTDSSRAEFSTTMRDVSPPRGLSTSPRGLNSPNNPSKETTPVKTGQMHRVRKQEPSSQATPTEEDLTDDEHTTPLIKQPEIRPISQEQLVAEVKGIYAGLVMVESKCIEVDNEQARAVPDRYDIRISLFPSPIHCCFKQENVVLILKPRQAERHNAKSQR